MEKGSEFYPEQKYCLSSEITSLEVEEVVQISVLDQPILAGFPGVLASNRRLAVRESTPHCCGFSEGVYIPP